MEEEKKVTKYCPVCCQEIGEKTRKCPHCQCRINKFERGLVTTRHIIEFLTFIAALFIIKLMFDSNGLTRTAIEQTEKSLIKVDSSLVLLREQNQIQQEQTQLFRQELEILRGSLTLEQQKTKSVLVDMEERNRPRVEIIASKVDTSGATLAVHCEFENSGFADAVNVNGFVIFKSIRNPRDSVSSVIAYDKISKRLSVVGSYGLPLRDWNRFLGYIALSYEWSESKRYYAFQKYYIYELEQATNQYRTKVLDKEDAKNFWKK